MKQFNQVLESTLNFGKKVFSINAAFRKEFEQAQQYNLDVKGDKIAQAEQQRKNATYQALEIYWDSVKAADVLITDKLEQYFTTAINKDEAATLDNLEKIDLTESEMKLHFEKFRNSPLALRRLGKIAQDKGYNLTVLIEEFSENVKGYDHYKASLSDYMRSSEKLTDFYQALDPEKELDEMTQITIDIQENSFRDETEAMQEVFLRIEGKENEQR